MLGGMSGGGMGFLFSPERKAEAQDAHAGDHERDQAADGTRSVPFAMEPVVYDFAINERGTQAALHAGDDALMPAGYYTLQVPPLIRTEMPRLSPVRRAELERFTAACRTEGGIRRHDARPCSTTCCRRARIRRAAESRR